ncbi:cell division protein FtsL [Virgibacillus natechei]|uniref:Cell division protein FtsL n=1 Tax=Virgibacillus natechei TaxID=1216297 RepID=A0ABS4IB96_9BACI|nr:cell division protein FtsL [Virgibacillus natechei]MBP1968200.1 cell division protein FtsL [Virgibacillus natechei]UZD14528.1 cell division protein FtsL [Virgibacillus natechei]
MSANHARHWTQPSRPTDIPHKESEVAVKVRKQPWITKGEKIIYSIIATCLIIAGILTVSYSSSTESLNRELQSLEQTVQNQQVTNEALLFEVKELSRPERITSIAKDNDLKIQDAEVMQANSFNN